MFLAAFAWIVGAETDRKHGARGEPDGFALAEDFRRMDGAGTGGGHLDFALQHVEIGFAVVAHFDRKRGAKVADVG